MEFSVEGIGGNTMVAEPDKRPGHLREQARRQWRGSRPPFLAPSVSRAAIFSGNIDTWAVHPDVTARAYTELSVR